MDETVASRVKRILKLILKLEIFEISVARDRIRVVGWHPGASEVTIIGEDGRLAHHAIGRELRRLCTTYGRCLIIR